jgi:hypothetical protein
MTQGIVTGHAGFDREAKSQYIGTGNVWADVQFSGFIRPRTETECNGQIYAEGQLRDFDLKPFREGGLPRDIERAVLEATETRQVILYRFQHHDGDRRVIHGFVLTHDHTRQYERILSKAVGPTRKSECIIDAVQTVVSNPPGTAQRFKDDVIPAAAEMGMLSICAMESEIAAVVTEIAGLVAEGADGHTEGEYWRAWTAIAERRMPFATAVTPGCIEAVTACLAILDEMDPAKASQVTDGMVALEGIARSACENLAGGSHYLAVTDAIVAKVAEMRPAAMPAV